MNNVNIVYGCIMIFLIGFSIHEFEEALFLVDWMRKNKEIIREKIPLVQKIQISKQSFSFIIYEEFILLYTVLLYIILTAHFSLLIGIMIAYTLHIFIHIIQMIVLKQIIPGIYGGILSIFATIPMIYILQQHFQYKLTFIVQESIVIFLIVVVNLVTCHILVHFLEKKRIVKCDD